MMFAVLESWIACMLGLVLSQAQGLCLQQRCVNQVPVLLAQGTAAVSA